MATKIVIVDDHDIIREGIKGILKDNISYKIVGEGADGQEAVDLVQKLKPDVLLLDITMPVLGGLEVIDRIKRISKDTKVIILTVHKMGAYVQKALSSGVNGYINKENAAEELLVALDRVMRGKLYLSEDISTYLADQVVERKGEKIKPEELLSQRELDILRLVAEGKTAKEAAQKLCLSRRTIENHKNNILKKLNLNRTTDLVKYAIENKIV